MNPVVPSLMLEGDVERRYLDQIQSILRAARLNSYYPDVRALASHLKVLSPSLHRGLYPGVDVDLRSGLPTYREWTRAQTDVAVSAESLSRLGQVKVLREKAKSGNSAHLKLLNKYDYYSAIGGAMLVPLGDMVAQLRRVDGRTAHYTIVLDKLDASGVFVRYTVDCAQPVDRGGIVTLGTDEVARHTAEFRSLIYRFSALDAEKTFIKLATLGGLEVERVVKGIVGPFFFPWSQATPASLKELVAKLGYVATFGLDTAAVDIEVSRFNDPIASARGGYELHGTAAGREAESVKPFADVYRQFQDRKFVVPRQGLTLFKRSLYELGSRNLIYGAQPVR